MTLTVGSLFSGVGGFDLGFRSAGLVTRWMCEIDTQCRKVLVREFPEVATIYTNVLTMDGALVEPVDVICGGFPCQDLSVAGKRAGMIDGARSSLFFEFMRVVKEMRNATGGVYPAFVVIENVPGLLSSADGADFGVLLDTLADIGAVDVSWRILDAQFYGVAQRRRRVFVVADFGGRRAAEVLALTEGLSGHPAPRREAGQNVAGTLTDSTGSRGWSSSVDHLNFVPMAAANGVVTREVAAALTANYGKQPDNSDTALGPNLVAYGFSGGNSGDSYGVAMTVDGTPPLRSGSSGTNQVPTVAYGMNSQLDSVREGVPVLRAEPGGLGYPVAYGIRAANTSSNGWGISEDATHTLDGATPHAVAFGIGGDDTSYTLRANPSHSGDKGDGGINTTMVAFTQNEREEVRLIGGDGQTVGALAADALPHQQNYLATPMAVRRLTPTECESLMGWPRNHTAGFADSVRYRMCGNGVVAPVAEWIGKRLIAAAGGAA